MITANELRVGNWVLFDVEEVYEQINARHIGYIAHANSKGQIHPFKPIKLTEEILLKLGFIRGSVTMYFLPIPNLKCEIHATWFHNEYVIELQNDRIPIVTEVKYLHQLQNLFYALTGEELEVNL